MTIQLIVTHPGGAHKDDFLACSLLAHLHGVPIQRRDPTNEDLANPSICVVDVDGAHDSELNNFDHHMLKRWRLAKPCPIVDQTLKPKVKHPWPFEQSPNLLH